MNNLLRTIAPLGFAAFAVAASSIAPASAAVWNSRDCKYYGVCAPWDLQYPSASSSAAGTAAPYAGGRVFSTGPAYQGGETEGEAMN